MLGTAVAVCIGLVVSNYLYQAIGQGDWAKAFERSWFQVTAIGIFLGVLQLVTYLK